MEYTFTKGATGLVPFGDEAVEWLAKQKRGTSILVEPRVPRNGAFHKKWFALVKLAFEYWSENAETIHYKGHPVAPNFERFRKDVTIMCGHYHPVVGIKEELRIEPDSISWAAMDEATFEKLYEATIRVILKQVFNGRICPTWTEEQLRDVAEKFLEFAA